MAFPTRNPGRRGGLLAVPCLLLAMGALVGCGSSAAPFRLLIEVQVAPQSNQNSPIPVTLVAVRDRKLFERFSQMSAKQWYEQRDQLRRDYPGGDAFSEWEWEFVPGFAPPPTVVEIDGDSAGAFLFANYRSPGPHRVRLGPHQRIRIGLGEEDVVITTLDPLEK